MAPAHNIVSALGPGEKLRSLSAFAPDYKRVRAALSDLLVFPHLENISLDDKTSGSLRDTVVDGDARFSSLSTIDVSLARKAVSWNETLTPLITEFDVAMFVASMAPIAKSYADEARAQEGDNQRFFLGFGDYIHVLNGRIDSMSARLKTLDADILSNQKKLEDLNILTTLHNIFKDIYKLAGSLDGASIQIATLLNVDLTSLQGSFGQLFTDRVRLNQIVAALSSLRSDISDLKVKFMELSGGLTNVMKSSSSLLNVWDDVAQRMETVASVTTKASDREVDALTKAWGTVAEDAQAYINVLTSRAAELPHRSFQSYLEQRETFGKLQKVPQTAEELRVYKFALTLPKHRLDMGRTKSADPEVVEKVLGPPQDAIDRLNTLGENAGRIINQFDELLRQPYLEQLACTDPLDGSKTNVFNMVAHFKQEYIALQQKTIPVARDLLAYAEVQQTLLPWVVVKPERPDDLAMSDFLATNSAITKEYLEKATELSNESYKMKENWNGAIGAVQKAINECTKNINAWEKSVDEMTQQQKKAIIFSVFSAIGAFLAFTAAAFIPGVGILAALAIGGTLGGLSIQQAIDAKKLGTAIKELNAQIENAKDTRGKLQKLLPYMETIADSVTQVSQIWSDIATTLTSLNAFYGILNGPTGHIMLEKLRDKMIEQWHKVGLSVVKYVDTIVG